MFLKFGTSCIVFLSPFHVIYIKKSSHDMIPLTLFFAEGGGTQNFASKV